jgi:hypothetical protein
MADNLDQTRSDNQDQQKVTSDTTVSTTDTGATTTKDTGAFSWKSQLEGDLSKAPLLSKFEDTKEGFNKFTESHYNLEKLLGNDKVPIPKNAEDIEGWSRFSKAMGIPDKAEAYGLPDAQIPDTMKDLTFDKQQFAEIVHSFKLTPDQAKGLWGAYTKQNIEAYGKAMEAHKTDMIKVVNQLKSEWGDAYDGNVELGQMVINKFSADKESADYITSVLTKDPKAIKFLAKIGEQFAENKIGDFGYKRFSLSPEQAREEIEKISKDPNHPYRSEKASNAEHNAALDYVNNLIKISKGMR